MHSEVESLIPRALIWRNLKDLIDLVLVHLLHTGEAQLFRLLNLHLSLGHLLLCQLTARGFPRRYSQAASLAQTCRTFWNGILILLLLLRIGHRHIGRVDEDIKLVGLLKVVGNGILFIQASRLLKH